MLQVVRSTELRRGAFADADTRNQPEHRRRIGRVEKPLAYRLTSTVAQTAYARS